MGTELNWQESVFSHKLTKFEWTIMMYFQNKHSLIVFCLIVLSYCVQIGKYYLEIWVYVTLKHFIQVPKMVYRQKINYLIFKKSLDRNPRSYIKCISCIMQCVACYNMAWSYLIFCPDNIIGRKLRLKKTIVSILSYCFVWFIESQWSFGCTWLTSTKEPKIIFICRQRETSIEMLLILVD